MRAAKLVEVQKIEVVEMEKPEIKKDNEVLVQVKAVGICGTDLHIFHDGRADVTLPRIMGHELSGLVKEVGKNVTNVKSANQDTRMSAVMLNVMEYRWTVDIATISWLKTIICIRLIQVLHMNRQH